MRKAFTILMVLLSIGAMAQNKVIWYDPITVADKTFGNIHPRVTLDRNHKPMVIWGDDMGRIFLSKWVGRGFDTPMQVNTPGKQAFAESWAGPEIVSRGDTIYLTYKELPENTGHVYIKHSYNGGKDFSIETQVDDSDNYISRFPTLAIDPYGHPLVAYLKLDPDYTNPRFVVAKSKDLGETFMGEALITDYSGGKVSDCNPATISQSGNAAIILYRDNLNGQRNVWSAFSNNSGISFGKGLQVDQTNWMSKECPASPPHGVIISDTLYSVFSSSGGDSSLVYLSKASVTGMAATTAPITGKFSGLTNQSFPRIANYGNAIALSWIQSVYSNNQLCMYFTNEVTQGLPEKFDKITTGIPTSTDVALGGGHVYLIWSDDSSGNIMCRVGSYNETITNKLLAENTTVSLQRAANGRYFMVSLPDISSVMMLDIDGKEYEMDVKCKKNNCKVSTEELDPGIYVVKIFGKDDKIYTYKYEVKEIKEKEEKERKRK